MRNTAITQVALIGISIVIIFSYIRPTFANIRVVQDEVFQYADATAKANEFNSLLQQTLARERGFTAEDKAALNRFLPATVDQLAVMHDLSTIISNSNAQVVDMKAGEVIKPNTDVTIEEGDEQLEESLTVNKFASQEFTVNFSGDYTSFKSVLRNLESTGYIFEIKSLEFGSVGEETGQFNPLSGTSEYSLTVKVYALAEQI